VLPVKLDFVDQLVNKENKEPKENPESLDHWDPQDHKELMVRPVWLDQLE